ncbi:MAG: hypothetical protein MUF15_24500 [Acidobacteria bacterium]|nr:hypothetical protein [Acidobacteriota bacterium]
MKSKNLIIIIVVLIGVLGNQFLGAEQVCGYSIYPGLKIPGPSVNMTRSTVVMSKTIFQSNAKWLKIHFSEFSLNDDSFVDLIGMNGTVVVRIKGSDVSNDTKSRYKVKKISNNKINFWGPALDGDTIRIELHRGTGKHMANEFIIDKVGVGTEPLREMREEIAMIESICEPIYLQNIACYYEYEPFDRGQAVGRMYYEKNGCWYRGNGFLCSCNNSSTFLTSYHIDSQSVVDTLEVQFGYQYANCTGTGPITSTTYFGDDYIRSDSSKHYCVLTLKDNPEEDFSPLEPLSREPQLGEGIYIVEHPCEEPKMIIFGNVSSIGGSGLYFCNYMDTIYFGSIGSPVLADDFYNLDKVLGFVYGGNCGGFSGAVKMSQIYAEVKEYIGCN